MSPLGDAPAAFHSSAQPAPVRDRRVAIAVAGLLAMHYLLAVTAVWQKSITFDEHMHLAQGCLRWVQPEYAFPAMNGIVAQRLAALPSVIAGISAPDMQAEPQRGRGEYFHARTLFYESGNDPIAMLRRGRATVAILSVACGYLAFLWSRELFGASGGLLTLALYTFSPFTLANAPLVTADTVAALGFLAATYAFWKVSHRATWRSLLASGAALPLLLLSKLSGVLMAPIFLAIVAVRVACGPEVAIDLRGLGRLQARSRASRASALAALLGAQAALLIALLWIFYDFNIVRVDFSALTEQRQQESGSSVTRAKMWIVETVLGLGLFPPAFADGLRMTLLAMESTYAFAAGRYSTEGFVWFFPFAFLVKTPLGVLGLLVTGLCAGLRALRARAARLYAVAPLLILLAIYGSSAVSSKINIGIRHILPMYAPLLILAGCNARWLANGPRWARWGVLALAGSTVASAAVAYPHYLAYFHIASGGSARGYRLLVDSSLDWGQDLPTLRRWLDRHRGPDEPVYLAYFGTGMPQTYGIDAAQLFMHFDWNKRELPPLRAGLYCISATLHVQTPFFGPWCVPFEEEYQRTRAAYQRWEASAPDERAHLLASEGPAAWQRTLSIYRVLRFVRLCAALRQREPDADAGYSILIYRLTAEEIAHALDGPPAELQPNALPGIDPLR
jgi:hypothetical protein